MTRVKKKQTVPSQRARPVLAKGYVHEASPLFQTHKPQETLVGDVKTADKDLYGDPFLQQARVQYLHKTDDTTAVIDGAEVLKQSELSAKTFEGSSPLKRIHWVPPLVIQQRKVGEKSGEIQVDTRGNFADIGLTCISFKNLIKQPIKVIINSPRARISDTTSPYLRRYKREIKIKPGQVRWFRAGWGDRANIFTPMSVWIPSTTNGQPTTDQYWQAFVLADFVVVVPDIDEMSGKSIEDLKAMGVCEVHINQRYISTATYQRSGTVVYQSRTPIAISRLSDFNDMLDETVVQVPTIQQKMSVRRYGTQMVLRTIDGDTAQLGLPTGTFICIGGVSGYFKCTDVDVVKWDINIDQPSDDFEECTIPSGVPVSVVGGELKAISLKDLIGYLTTITKILTVVASFL